MRRLKSHSVCPTCVNYIERQATLPNFMASWIGQRASLHQVRKAPSRMVLSNQVYKSPGLKPRRRNVDGPFGGMNRVVANIDPVWEAAQSKLRTKAERSSRGTRSRERETDGDERRALKMQRSLASISYGRRMGVKEKMEPYESFNDFGLLPSVVKAVTEELFAGLTDIKPTPVQRLAIPALLRQRSSEDKRDSGDEKASFLLAAETGTGKTLSYLLPAINALKIAEANDSDIKAYNQRYAEEKAKQEQGVIERPLDEPHPTMARPKIVVLVPTAELAQQIAKVSKTLSHVIKYKTEMLSSNLKPPQIHRNIYSPRGLDIVIATPHLLASIVDSDPNILSRVSHLIVDEADSLLDRSFAPVTTSIVERAMPSMEKLICCSATIPRKLNNYLATNYPGMIRITTPNLHAIPRRVQLGVIDVSREPYRNSKDLACADALYTIGREAASHEGPVKGELDVRRVIVFVNEREKTEEVAEFLRSKGIYADALHRDTPEKRHGEILETFTSPEPLKVPAPANPGHRRRLTNVRALVVTDLASRGIDTVAVRHVILYDVPHTTIDFIHRLGRAGRMGRRGRGICLVGNGDRRDVVAEVRESMYMGKALI